MYISSDNPPVLASFIQPVDPPFTYCNSTSWLQCVWWVSDVDLSGWWRNCIGFKRQLWSQQREQTWQLHGSGIISKITVWHIVPVLTRWLKGGDRERRGHGETVLGTFWCSVTQASKDAREGAAASEWGCALGECGPNAHFRQRKPLAKRHECMK